MTVITSSVNAYTANSVAPTASSGATGAVKAPTAAKASPNITLSNSSKVTLSKATTVAVTPKALSVVDAVTAYKAARIADPLVTPSPVVD